MSDKYTVIDPLDLYNAEQDIQQQHHKDSVAKDARDSVYVDPLEMEKKYKQNELITAEIIRDNHDKLMAKTGGQPVEKELGGWLLVFTVGMAAMLIYLIVDFGVRLFMLSQSDVDSAYIIPLVVEYGFPVALIAASLHSISRRHNPAKLFLILGLVSILIALMQMLTSSISQLGAHITSIVSSGTPNNGALAAVQALIDIAGWIILGIAPYIYFSTSKRVRRTLIK